MSVPVQESVLHVDRLDTLRSGIWSESEFRLECVASATERRTITPRVYPFLTVMDLKRLIWMEHGGDPRWSPDHVFLAVHYVVSETGADEYRPLGFHWPAAVGVELPDPLSPANRRPHTGLVDEQGDRLPNVRPVFTPEMTLADALSVETASAPDSLPPIVAISLAALLTEEDDDDDDEEEAADEAAMLVGFFQLYYPKIKVAAITTTNMKALYTVTGTYMRDRLGRMEIAEKKLAAGGDEGMTLSSVVRIRWSFPAPAEKPESLERTFYELETSAVIPFLRFFPANNGTPLLKLGRYIRDKAVLKTWLAQIPPSMGNQSLLIARIPLTDTLLTGAEAFTLTMYEDGSCDIRIEVSHRGTVFQASIAASAERALEKLAAILGFTTQPVLRDLGATYTWTHPDPRIAQTSTSIRNNVKALSPFVELEPPIATTVGVGQAVPLASCVWRAVSNFDSDAAQFAFLAEHVRETGGGDNIPDLQQLVMERFGLSNEEAERAVERWFTRAGEAVAPAAGVAAGAHAVAAHSDGTIIRLFGTHPSYSVFLQGVSSWSELRQIVSIVGVLLGSKTRELTLAGPSAAVVAASVKAAEKVAAAKAKAEAEVAAATEAEEAEEAPEDDSQMMALIMGMSGMGDDDDEAEDEDKDEEAKETEESEETEEPGAGIANSDSDSDSDKVCRGKPWKATDAPLTLAKAFYMDRLKELDADMFGYSIEGHIGYSKSCQRAGGRQPNVMTKAEYERMKRCYEGRVRIVNLPPQSPADLEGLPTTFGTADKTVFLTDPVTKNPLWTVYGYESKTRPGVWLYLICTEYWCVRDNLPLLASEFEGTEGRGFTKTPRTCPFCKGRLIQSTGSGAGVYKTRVGESVIQRSPGTAGTAAGIPLYIGQLKSKVHPKGFDFIPCCDSDPKTLRQYLKDKQAGVPIKYTSDKTARVAVSVAATRATIDYIQILSNMTVQYILSSDKQLQPGKIGLVSPALDRFFGQDSSSLLETLARPTFIKGVSAFVRLGVDSSLPGYNLFAALAPYMGLTTTSEVRKRIQAHLSVRAFESANYGTLMMEFAAESADTDLTPGLAEFAQKNGYSLTVQNRPHLLRLFGAWNAFNAYIADRTRPKRLRHFEHLLAYPGIFPTGLVLIAIETGPGGESRIMCPSFGLPTASMFKDVRVAFLSHTPANDGWEPLMLHTGGVKNAVRFFGRTPQELEPIPARFRASVATWIQTWQSSERGCGRPAPPPHVWSTATGADTLLPRLSDFADSPSLRGRVTGMVRDRSNRLAGILLMTATAPALPVFVPCLDDGNLGASVNRVYEFAAIPPTSLDVCVRLYREEMAKSFRGLEPVEGAMKDGQVFGFKTAAGALVPTGPSTTGPSGVGATGLPVTIGNTVVPWEMDKQIFGGEGENKKGASVFEQFNEAYQHVRLALARKIKRNDKFRRKVQELMGKTGLPLYERRKRMDILLEPVLHKWLSEGEEAKMEGSSSRLRTDCVATETESECVGACKWVVDAESGVEKCRIHVPVLPTTTEGSSVSPIFAARLSDELLRFPNKRRELMEDRVPTIRPPRGIMQVGDDLFAEARDADSLLDRLGFFLERAALTFPEEALTVAAAEEQEQEQEQEQEPVKAPKKTTEKTIVPPSAHPLPSTWVDAGFSIPNPNRNRLSREQARDIAFASGTRKPMGEWESLVQSRRTLLRLRGEAIRPLQWSTQDLYVLADITAANLLFIDNRGINQWIQPSNSTTTHLNRQGYILFWGPDQLLVVRRKPYHNYKFALADLPPDVAALLTSADPLPENEVRILDD